MKKVVILLLIILRLASVAQSQNYEVLYVDNSGHFTTHWFCYNDDTFDGIIIYGETSCDNVWYVTMWDGNENTVIIDEQGIDHVVINNQHTYPLGFAEYYVNYNGCDIVEFNDFIGFQGTTTGTNPFAESIVWKRGNESAVLDANPNHMSWDCLWSTGEADETIEVIEPGIYSVTITDDCGSATYSIEVRDNVEIYRATTDLETNLNKTTWQVTSEQAEYISEVKVYRDGLLVGTAPYEQGYFLDAIGSDNAARNYRIVGVSVEGEDCPIESFEKGTIHTTYYQDVNSNLNMTWNVPYVEEGAQGSLTYFQICKYDPSTNEITVVDQVNASITDYTCGVNQFDGGQAVIAAVFNDGKGFEELSFSNLTTDILGLGENAETAFRIYPNPAKDRVTVEGTGILTVTNVLGQTVLTKEINGKEIVELPQGLYFVKMNGVTWKIVVE